MRTKWLLILCAGLFANWGIAQTNVTPVAPAAPSAPAKAEAKPEKKKAPAKKKTGTKTETPKPAAIEKPIVLVPGPAAISGDNVNIRGRPSFIGEVVARLKKGDKVSVIEQIFLSKPRPDEPANWAKIIMPAGKTVWVHSTYIDATNKTVLPRRLNVRTGPGENYSVVGKAERGVSVNEKSRKGEWIEIDAPTNAFAYVAAKYLKQEGEAPAVPPIVSIAPPVAEPPAQAKTLPDSETVAPPPTNDVASAAPTVPTTETTQAPPPAEEPLPPRIVTHEGVVRPTVSIQAPTPYEIWDPQTHTTINYLHTTSTNLDLSLYRGLRIIVTGEEGLDERWKTPLITIQRIQVVE